MQNNRIDGNMAGVSCGIENQSGGGAIGVIGGRKGGLGEERKERRKRKKRREK